MSTNRWIKMCCLYTLDFYPAKQKKNEIMPFAATWTYLEIVILSDVSQRRKTNTLWYHLYVKSKIWHKWTYLWDKNIIRDIENRLVCAKGEGVKGGVDWEYGLTDANYNIEWINSKVLLYHIGIYNIAQNYIQYPMTSHNGKECEKECVCVCV